MELVGVGVGLEVEMGLGEEIMEGVGGNIVILLVSFQPFPKPSRSYRSGP